MEPGLSHGDFLLVDVAAYRGRRRPRESDVVVFCDPQRLERILVKRVAAVPGETLMEAGGNIFITGGLANGRRRWLTGAWSRGAVTVPHDHYVVLGENPWLSRDSRTWGLLPLGHILGKAVLPRSA